MFSYIRQDFSRNKAIKSKFILGWFRLCQLIINIRLKPVRILLLPIVGLYRIIVDWFMGVDLPPKLTIGKGIKLYHGQGLVIGSGSIIGENSTLRHGVTIGRKLNKDGTPSKDPVIGNNVEFGAYSMAIGNISFGDNCSIGAGVVVTKSLEENTVVVNQPFRVLVGSILTEQSTKVEFE